VQLTSRTAYIIFLGLVVYCVISAIAFAVILPTLVVDDTFLFVIPLFIYIGLFIVTLAVFVPLLIFGRTRLIAVKVLATVLISFPCLITMGLFGLILISIPALIISRIPGNFLPPETLRMMLGVTSLLIFVGLVALFSVYLWYLLSKIIYQLVDKKPVAEFLATDEFFQFLRTNLFKLMTDIGISKKR
jgi:hypothetical protein